MRRLLIAVLGFGLLGSSSAEACGTWSLVDREKGWTVVFHSIRTGLVPRPGERRSSRQLMWLAGKSWQPGRGHSLRFKGSALYLDERRVGDYTASRVRIGERVFRLRFGKDYRRYDFRGLVDSDGQSVVVRRGDRVVLEGAALGDRHCQEPPIRRIALYLAWRELLPR